MLTTGKLASQRKVPKLCAFARPTANSRAPSSPELRETRCEQRERQSLKLPGRVDMHAEVRTYDRRSHLRDNFASLATQVPGPR